jgi:hypothetical protein
MSSFEWMELQTLARDIIASRSRLAKARSEKDTRLVRALEEEINAAEKRRSQLLSHITDDLASDRSPPQSQHSDTIDPGDTTDEAPIPPASSPPLVGGAEHAATAWEQLTPADIERAMSEIDVRRADTIARHTAELNALDAELAELDNLEEAIEVFTRRFNFTASAGAIVPFDERHGRRQQAIA